MFINAFIRIILAGPLNVGKTSIRRVFTQLGLQHDSPPTEICEVDDKMFEITTFELLECKKYDLRNTLNRIIVAAIERFLLNTDQKVDPLIDRLSNQSIGSQTDLLQNNRKIEISDTMLSNTKAQNESFSVNQQELHHQHQRSNIEPVSPLLANESLTQHVTLAQIADSDTISSKSNDTDMTEKSYDQLITNSNVDISRLQSSISQIYQQVRSQLQDQPPIIDKQFAKLFDFGGQSIYHITHRPFMSTNSIYVLVFNITQDIDKPVITRDGNAIKMTYFEVMQEWLTSIIGGNTNKEEITATIDGKKSKYLLPIVILVASHGDCVDTEEQRINKYNEFAESLLSRLSMYESNVCRSQIIFNCKDNDLTAATEEDRRRCCSKLHSFINGFAKSLPFMEKKIPLRWYITVALLHLAANNEAIDSYAIDNTIINQVKEIQNVSINKIMKFTNIRKIIIAFGLYESNKKLIDMLSYLHDIGEIIYCPTADDDGIIVVDVDWFLNIMREIVRLHDPKSENARVIAQYRQLTKTGKMSKTYLDCVLANNKLTEQEITVITQLLIHYDIICEIDPVSNEEIEYFVPYLLHPDVCSLDKTEYTFSNKLFVGYNNNQISYIPDGIFYCLLISCLKEWNNSKVKIYHHYVKFFVQGDDHYIIIKKKKSHVSIRYCYNISADFDLLKERYNRIEDSIYNKRPHELIKSKLSEIVKQRLPMFKEASCQFYVKCINCKKLTSINENNKSTGTNDISCWHCDARFNCQSMQDWMINKKESLSGKLRILIIINLLTLWLRII